MSEVKQYSRIGLLQRCLESSIRIAVAMAITSAKGNRRPDGLDLV